MASDTDDVIHPDWIPAKFYQDPDQDRREAAFLWPHVWQMACREAELPSVGSYVRYDIVDDSILLVRTGTGKRDIVAYYNVCQHRGRELKQEMRGQLGSTIACRFHGWQWKIDGSLYAVHRPQDWEGCPDFNTQHLALPPVRVDFWGGWAWINQDSEAESLKDYLGIVPEMLDPFEFEKLSPVYWKTLIAPVNWKIVAEAFNEGYHSWATHSTGVNYRHMATPSAIHGLHGMFANGIPSAPGEFRVDDGRWRLPTNVQENLWANTRHIHRTLGALMLEPAMTAANRVLELPEDTPPEHVFPAMFQFQREELARRGVAFPEKLTIEALFRAGQDWHIFPNTIVLPSVDGALWYRLRPNGRKPDSCIFDIWSFGRFAPGEEPAIINEVSDGFEAFKGQCAFLEEDFSNMAAVARGVRSRGFKGARTNPYQESAITNFRQQLDIWCKRRMNGQ